MRFVLGLCVCYTFSIKENSSSLNYIDQLYPIFFS